MTVFITGATGFIGSHLAKRLSEKEEVVVLVRDIRPSKWLDLALSKTIKVRGDIRDYRTLLRIMAEHEVDRVYHLAARSKVKSAFKDPIGVFESNIMGTVNVLEACRQTNAKAYVMMTDKIFGEGLNAKYDNPIQSTEPYGTSKASGDLICETYHTTYDLPIVRIRSCNVYGLDLYSNRIIPNTIKACLNGENPIIFKMENETLRQYVYIDDIVEAIISSMKAFHYGVFNLATNDLLNQEDVVLTILKWFPKLVPRFVKRDGPKEISRQSMICSSDIRQPKYSFYEGIKSTIKQFRKYYNA